MADPASGSAPPAGMPVFQQRNLLLLGAAVLGVWVLALLSNSKWVVGGVAVLTVALAGVLAWAWRWARKQQQAMNLLRDATASPEARKDALTKLKGSDDAMDVLVRAQLEAQEDPEAALETLRGIDMKKVPAQMEDDVRVMRAQLCLMLGQSREAREQADLVKLSNSAQNAQPEGRAMVVSTVAEAWARTGKHKEALDLLANLKLDEKQLGQARAPLLYARIFAHFASSQRDAVRREMTALVKMDPNLLGRFVMPKARVHPELEKMAKDVLAQDPQVRKDAQKYMNRAQRRQQRR